MHTDTPRSDEDDLDAPHWSPEDIMDTEGFFAATNIILYSNYKPPETPRYSANLATTHVNLGRLAGAEELLLGVLPVSRRVRGTALPETLCACTSA